MLIDAVCNLGVTIGTIILTPFFLLLILISELTPPMVDTDVSNYTTYRQELNYAVEFMPSLDELGEYEELRFGYQETPEFIFCPTTMSLTIKYGAGAYEAMKQQVLAGYDFIDAPVIDTDGYILLDDFFTHKGYDFYAVAVCETGYYACKYFGLVGINDNAHCIAWLYYDDVDRDYIARPDEDLDQEMCKLTDDYFHWKPFTE